MNLKVDVKKIIKISILLAGLIGLMIIAGANDEKYYKIRKLNEEEMNVSESSILDNSAKSKIIKDTGDEEEISYTNSKRIVVYVCGAVNSPKVIELKPEERLDVAVKAAGGMTSEADIEEINLAMKLTDGAQYIIPVKGKEMIIRYDGDTGIHANNGSQGKVDEESTGVVDSNGIKSKVDDGKININTASQNQLNELKGIGDVLSTRIIEYREKHNGFKSIDELRQVEGIGDKKFNDIKDKVSI
ncbi:MAG: helix-hairpin-helix domain-containing protein [Filifactoraceae bacterium]